MRFQLGEKVRFRSAVQKMRYAGRVSWEKDYSDPMFTPGTFAPEGIVIGMRTLLEYNVHRESEFSEWSGTSYTYTVSDPQPGTQKRAWLIAFDLRRKPILVFDEDVEKI